MVDFKNDYEGLVVFSASWCKYCSKLKKVLAEEGIAYTNIDIDENIEESKILLEKGLETIPQVFYNGKHIGGCDTTIDMIRTGGVLENL